MPQGYFMSNKNLTRAYVEHALKSYTFVSLTEFCVNVGQAMRVYVSN